MNNEKKSCDNENYLTFKDIPSQIIVNGILQNYTGYIVYNLERVINNITMIWNHTVTDCKTMFKDLVNITRIDLSKFDSSEVMT